ncbi:hypothetical protein ANCCAN_11189 [Ancylostoma caninum]|uniref:ATP-dependent DNA helicase n=1 Tax=Ancylostoma caninum TaxID=29170 RepID=A0A368GEM8_ANCCA|nr:hypothetical protein ANCCAN_11189 [Ancylostoma caninum]
MVPKFALEAVDLLLQYLMGNTLPFGGKIVVLGRDFRQVLPSIERGGDCDMVDACIKNSNLWRRFWSYRLSTNMRAADSGASWCDFPMSVGNGNAAEDEHGHIELPSSNIANGNLIDNVLSDQITNEDSLIERAILAPRTLDVNRIKEEALDKLPGQLRVYRSIDEVVDERERIQQRVPEQPCSSWTTASCSKTQTRGHRDVIEESRRQGWIVQ